MKGYVARHISVFWSGVREVPESESDNQAHLTQRRIFNNFGLT